MSWPDWIRHHRTGVLIAVSVVLGVFVPIPGFFVAAFFWPAGIHDLESTSETFAFLAILIGISCVVWAAIGNAVLPKRR